MTPPTPIPPTKVDDSHFQYQLRVSQGARLVQIFVILA